MIDLMKNTYILDTEKIEKELEKLWVRYQKILEDKKANWEDMNEARAILYLTGDIYCEQIAVGVIERRIHLLKKKIKLIDFFNIIDGEKEELKELRKDKLFNKLEKFYRIVKKYKNKYNEGKYYLDEEKFIEKHEEKNPNKSLKMGYRGGFEKK